MPGASFLFSKRKEGAGTRLPPVEDGGTCTRLLARPLDSLRSCTPDNGIEQTRKGCVPSGSHIKDDGSSPHAQVVPTPRRPSWRARGWPRPCFARGRGRESGPRYLRFPRCTRGHSPFRHSLCCHCRLRREEACSVCERLWGGSRHLLLRLPCRKRPPAASSTRQPP